jgi:hypothetical protein
VFRFPHNLHRRPLESARGTNCITRYLLLLGLQMPISGIDIECFAGSYSI